VEFTVDLDFIDDEVGKDQAIHVYRIVQEGINNILKHAGASEGRVIIRVEKDSLRITIGDNGMGASQSSPDVLDGRHGFGLVGIFERAKVMNGSMTIESAPNKGTTLTVLIPRPRKTT
jgi:signal transduction histidine kinase